jgi:uncharacterized phage protein (TIGR01671 family)
MRQIKFRAFVKKDKAMVSDVRIGNSLNECFKSDGVVFMQFTGLLDVNGVEIYEGDIVSMSGLDVSYYDSGKYCRGSVEFVNGAFQQVFTHDDGKRFYGELSDIEVCGNIYQNPELLK